MAGGLRPDVRSDLRDRDLGRARNELNRSGQVTLHSELASVAAELLGVEAVRVYHDQALVNRAGGGRTPWHQDQWYWPLDTVGADMGPTATAW
ncbi:MAG: phytanoyl-CoA dioxygenase family protein [Actinomycetota bacterium]